MKKRFEEAKKLYDSKNEEELKKTGIFYAFGNKQFEENRTYKEESTNSDYIYVMSGAYIHKKDKSKLDNYFTKILPAIKKEFINSINIDDLIEYELINHECYYTGDFYEIIPLIESYLDTDISQRNDVAEQIEIVYKNTYKKNMEAFE